ncbi:Uncharacterised protein [Legionella steigerwaltii]|uniref:Uncharacterized protein n=1 Tax=Legionella steigerwaltii TaxID=460 RepID=A0A378L3S0_9GAMM|nr:hypothetical protein [Legionella steigerwaltii]KTD79456.1 hypothetical protein Lstg_0672 [Legionella steigerwaltii]STY21443.1 Uncharacterised protein [Legionella steigerwaltii]
MSMSKVEPQLYYLDDTVENLYKALGLGSMLKRDVQETNHQIKIDLYPRVPMFRVHQIREKMEEHFLPKPEKEDPFDPIRNRYMQGDMYGENLKFLLGDMPFYDLNDPERGEDTPKVINVGAAYIDSKDSPSGLTILYRKGRPDQWMIIIAKDTHLPPEKRHACVLSSIDPNNFLPNNSDKVTVGGMQQLSVLQKAADSTAISAIIGSIVDENGNIKEHANIFHALFTGHILEHEKFDDDEKWMSFIEKHASDIMKNRCLIALHSMGMKLSLEQVEACLNEKSELYQILTSILDNVKIQQKSLYIDLALNLHQLNHVDGFSLLEGESEKFIDFFNRLASDSKNHDLLGLILEKKTGIDFLRLIHKCTNANVLMQLILDDPNPLDKLEKLNQFAKEVVQYKFKNENILSLTVQFLLTYPDRVLEYQKLISFLNETPGIEKIKPELLIEFLSVNLDNSQSLNSVQETLTKLDALKISDSKSYELALGSQEFRKIVDIFGTKGAKEGVKGAKEGVKGAKEGVKGAKEGVKGAEEGVKGAEEGVKGAKDSAKEEKEIQDNQKRIELAKNLLDLGYLSVFSQLSTNLSWVSSFNQFVKNTALKAILVEKLAANDVPACKLILENSLLNELVAANIAVDKDLVDKILNPKNELAKKLQTITKETNPERKKALYQLAIDLDRIGVLGAFGKFKKDNNEFLNVFHKLVAIPNSNVLLKQMLSRDNQGIDILRLMASTDSDKAVKFFEEFSKLSSSEQTFKNVNDQLLWLKGANLQPKVVLMAIELLFKHPDIKHEEFKDVVLEFLKGSPTPNFGTTEVARKLREFPSQHYQNKDKELRSEVKASFHKLAENSVNGEKYYGYVLESPPFRAIVLSLPPISEGKESCGFFKTDGTPRQDELNNKTPRYILTDKALLYYTGQRLLTISEDLSKIASLNKKFTNLPIDKLTKEQFKQLTDIVPIKEYNEEHIKLAGHLYKFGHIEKYHKLADNNQLASYFNQFMAYQNLEDVLREKLKISVAATTAFLGNKRLRAMMDANIEPNTFASKAQIRQLLNPHHEKSRAMDILLELNLKNNTAYQWTFVDTPAAKNFRKILFAIHGNETIELATQSKMIETLCSVQLAGKDVFSLYLRDGEQGEKFKKIVLNLPPVSEGEESCGFFKMPKAPTRDELSTYTSSRYILTEENGLLYFNPADKKLLTITKDKSQIDALNKKFTQLPIVELTNEQFNQLTEIVPIKENNAQRVMCAYNLCELGHLDKYDQFTDPEQISYFNKFCDFPNLKAMLSAKLNISVEETKVILDNRRLRVMIDANINHVDCAIFTPQLLDQSHPKSKAMDILLALNLKNKEAINWAFTDTQTAINFREVLSKIAAINDKNITPESKAKMIETLCSLQKAGKEVFSMYLNNNVQGEKFRDSLSKIEMACTKVTSRWEQEKSEDAQAKTRAFAAEEQNYRRGLYEVVFDHQTKPMANKVFEAKIAKASENMLSVVDVRRRSWITAILETLAEALNLISCTKLSRATKGTTFFSRTTSGQEVRNLNESLSEKDTKKITKEYKERMELGNPSKDPVNDPEFVVK